MCSVAHVQLTRREKPIILAVELFVKAPVPTEAIGAAMEAFAHFCFCAQAQHALQRRLTVPVHPADGTATVDYAAVPSETQRVAAVAGAVLRNIFSTACRGAIASTHDNVRLDRHALHYYRSGSAGKRSALDLQRHKRLPRSGGM